MRRTLFLLFLVHFLTRLIFVNITGVNNNFIHQCDSYWLVKLADIATTGDFNFDIGRFIASPLFPAICALLKIIASDHWGLYLILFQIVLSSMSGLYIYRISMILFSNKEISMLSSLIYAVFPMTMWYVHTFSQESLFQSFLIISIYYLLASLKTGRISDTIKAAVFFSLTYLTKSHILLFALFIPLIYFHSFRLKRKTLILTGVFALLAIGFSIPYGMYQLKKNGTYVLSSNGAGYQFYLGNTEAAYRTIVDIPKKNTPDYDKMEDITVYAGYFNGSKARYDSILASPQKTKQQAFIHDAITWIKTNPVKFIQLKIYDAFFFFFPGVSFRHYDFLNWLFSFSLSLPLYYFGYKSIYKQYTTNFKLHSWIFYLTLSMFVFSTFWYVQNRFRTITLEPFYIIYASVYLNQILQKFAPGKSFVLFLDYMFLEFTQSISIKKELMTFFKLNHKSAPSESIVNAN